jgi:hypothetical protein
VNVLSERGCDFFLQFRRLASTFPAAASAFVFAVAVAVAVAVALALAFVVILSPYARSADG